MISQKVRKLFPNGVDVVLDPLNGDNSIKGYNLLKPFGRICHYGAASIANENRSFVNAFKAWWKCLTVNSFDIISENKTVSGYHLGYLLSNHAIAKDMLADLKVLFDFYTKGVIKIKVDSVFSYSKIGEAMKRMHSRQNIGKVILKPDAEIATPSTPEHIKIVTTVVTTTTTTEAAEAVEPAVPNGDAHKHTNGDLPKITTETKIETPAQNGHHENGHKEAETVVASENGHHHHHESDDSSAKEKTHTKQVNGDDNQKAPVHEGANGGEAISA